MRVYIPATLAMLQSLNETGELAVVGRAAFAVTPALRESHTAGDDEELSARRCVAATPAFGCWGQTARNPMPCRRRAGSRRCRR